MQNHEMYLYLLCLTQIKQMSRKGNWWAYGLAVTLLRSVLWAFLVGQCDCEENLYEARRMTQHVGEVRVHRERGGFRGTALGTEVSYAVHRGNGPWTKTNHLPQVCLRLYALCVPSAFKPLIIGLTWLVCIVMSATKIKIDLGPHSSEWNESRFDQLWCQN